MILGTLDPYLSGDLSVRSTPADRGSALARSNSEAEGYLRSAGYIVPVTDATPDLQGRVADIARYHLAVHLQLLPEPADSSSLYTNYKAALEWLRDVAHGRVDLAITKDDPDSVIGSPQVVTHTKRGWGNGV